MLYCAYSARFFRDVSKRCTGMSVPAPPAAHLRSPSPKMGEKMNIGRSAISLAIGFTVTGAVLLVGCASNSGVVPIGKDTYTVTKQAATGFSGSGTLKAEAFQEASSYCDQHGKSLQVVSTHEASPPFILGNFPKAEVQFMCLMQSWGDRSSASRPTP